MKRTLNLSIPTPCTEKWENFEPRPTGGFCSTCSKTVVDLTRMSDDQIIDFFTNKPAHVCGRLRAGQLTSYTLADPVKINPGFTLFRAGLLSLFLLLAGKVASAQQVAPPKQQTEVVQQTEDILATKTEVMEDGFTVRGRVLDQIDNSPILGTNILLKGTTVGMTVTEPDGRFIFPQKLHPGDVLIIAFIGYVSQEYRVPKDFKEAEITLTLDMDVMGEIVTTGYYEEPSRLHKWWSKLTSWL